MKEADLTKVTKKDLVSLMYDLFYSSSSELVLLGNILDELAQREEDATKVHQLIMMSTEVNRYRIKMNNLTNGIFEKKYNIVAITKKQQCKQ